MDDKIISIWKFHNLSLLAFQALSFGFGIRFSKYMFRASAWTSAYAFFELLQLSLPFEVPSPDQMSFSIFKVNLKHSSNLQHHQNLRNILDARRHKTNFIDFDLWRGAKNTQIQRCIKIFPTKHNSKLFVGDIHDLFFILFTAIAARELCFGSIKLLIRLYSMSLSTIRMFDAGTWFWGKNLEFWMLNWEVESRRTFAI